MGLESEVSCGLDPTLRHLQSARLEQKLMDLLASFDWLLCVQCELAQALCCLLGRISEHVLLEELEVVVAANEVNATWAEDSEHDHWLLHPVKALHETVSPAGSR